MSLVARLAELAVVLGAGVQPGQVVHVDAEVAHGELVRAIAEAAYRHGARYVDVELADPHVHRARVMHAAEDTLAYAPAWREERIRELDAEHGAGISVRSPVAPGLLGDLDPMRVSRAERPNSPAWRDVEYRASDPTRSGYSASTRAGVSDLCSGAATGRSAPVPRRSVRAMQVSAIDGLCRRVPRARRRRCAKRSRDGGPGCAPPGDRRSACSRRSAVARR